MCSICENWLKNLFPGLQRPCRELRVLLSKACMRALTLEDVICYYTHLPAAFTNCCHNWGMQKLPNTSIWLLFASQNANTNVHIKTVHEVSGGNNNSIRKWMCVKEFIYILPMPWVRLCLWLNLKVTNQLTWQRKFQYTPVLRWSITLCLLSW